MNSISRKKNTRYNERHREMEPKSKIIEDVFFYSTQDMSLKLSVPNLVPEPCGYPNSSPWSKVSSAVVPIAFGSTLF